jgi:hypothetical protein
MEGNCPLPNNGIQNQGFGQMIHGINYVAGLRMTFRQNIFLQDWFRNKFGVGLG